MLATSHAKGVAYFARTIVSNRIYFVAEEDFILYMAEQCADVAVYCCDVVLSEVSAQLPRHCTAYTTCAVPVQISYTPNKAIIKGNPYYLHMLQPIAANPKTRHLSSSLT